MSRSRAMALQLVFSLSCSSCGSTFLPIESIEDREHGIPLSRSVHQRSGELTWRLGDVKRTGEALRIDFTLTNGTSRILEQGLLRVILHGPNGEQLSGRLPFSGIRRGHTRALSARFGSVPFRVADLGLEVIFVSP
ncbi:MAG: hypothetical protein GY723_16025 [bacterium]|nr:hypothetical protein [bacterium]MCP5069056.1 hypothetical protein [bacterium]